MSPRYLTKSRFKLATECPTKLFYTGKPEYADRKIEDSFLQALAEGGFQVGELAKCYFPGGYEVSTLDHEEALAATNELLRQDNVVVFEAAVRFENLFIRMDVLVKKGNSFELIEVKAKSINLEDGIPFLTKSGTISADWKSYLYDVAFQKYVMNQAFPGHQVSGCLMLTDKSAVCPTDGLNQKFRIVKDDKGRKKVIVADKLTPEDLSTKLLSIIPVDEYLDLIYAAADSKKKELTGFADRVSSWSEKYADDEKIYPVPSSTCGSCEFFTTKEDDEKGLKSGRNECWTEAFKLSATQLKAPTIFDIWNCRKKDSFIEEQRITMDAVDKDDISPKDDGKPGLSQSERQWLQVEKVQENDRSVWIDRDSLSAEMNGWTFPLHFIDFETAMAAIPFNKGRHPYEGIAFQFSHHTVDKEGRVEHKGQYLNIERGVFPNYDFIRALKNELDQDQGTIFRYSNHENTYLNIIYRQLIEDENPIPDKEKLCGFIRSITKSAGSCADKWEGGRNMVDLWELVKRYYYDPATNGSNSMKHVLPAILNSSKYLQEKYAEPVYGAQGGIPSLNYTDWQWIVKKGDEVVDPYKLLPKMFQDISDKDFELLSDDEVLKEGGAAMAAYARMQFEEMSDYERNELQNALLKYCELDTLGMVMLYEGWREMI